jgi:hypothetical protein
MARTLEQYAQQILIERGTIRPKSKQLAQAAWKIIDEGRLLARDLTQYQVEGSARNGQREIYTVTINADMKARCSCLAASFGNECKHALAVSAYASAFARRRDEIVAEQREIEKRKLELQREQENLI